MSSRLRGWGESARGAVRWRLYRLASSLDRVFHFADREFNNVDGHIVARLKIVRHSLAVLLLPTLLAFFLIASPIPGTGSRFFFGILGSFLLLGVLCLFHALAARKRWALLWEALGQALLLALVALVVLALSPAKPGSPGGMYVHALLALIWVPIIIVVLPALILARFYIGRLQAKQKQPFRGLPLPPHLFRHHVIDTIRVRSVLRAFVLAPVRTPLQALVIPALIVLCLPGGLFNQRGLFDGVLRAGLAGLLIVWFGVLALGEVNSRLSAMLNVITHLLLRGGARLVSFVVIALAIARIAGLHYVTNVLNNTSNMTLPLLVACAYVIFWWADYWINRLLLEELLPLLGDVEAGGAHVEYAVQGGAPGTQLKYRFQVHGASRLAFRAGTLKREEARQGRIRRRWAPLDAHGALDVFERLVHSARASQGAAPQQLKGDYRRVLNAAQFLSEIKGRVSLYYLGIAVLAMFAVGGMAFRIHSGGQKPQVTVRTGQSAGVDLSKWVKERCASDEPLIVVAASGGGTRAALFTASVLEGLERKKLLKNVVLAGGISGGSAALAYFAAHRPRLVSEGGKNADPKAWEKYFAAMKYSYIQDVLDGSVALRIVLEERLGTLLEESFESHWDQPLRQKLQDVRDVGLIFQTSIAGHELLGSTETPSSTSAGGRLIFTNLELGPGFPSQPHESSGLGPHQEQRLWTKVITDGTVELTAAASLSANFPPVFPNAAVAVDEKWLYWVTDGGATDNRGMEMLLYALRETLTRETLPEGCRLPNLRFLVIEASALSDEFSQDRGLGPVFSAGRQFASQLAVELHDQIKELYRRPGDPDGSRFQIHILPMPRVFRQPGGLGTHWMLPAGMVLKDKMGEPVLHEGKSVRLDETALVAVIRGLHFPNEKERSGLTKPEPQDMTQWALEFIRAEEYESDVAVLTRSSSNPNDVLPLKKKYADIWAEAIDGLHAAVPGGPASVVDDPGVTNTHSAE